MTMRSFFRSLPCLLATFAALQPAPASDSASFYVPLTSTGLDADARGTVTGKFSPSRSTLSVSCSRLDPSAPFEFRVGGQTQAVGTSSRGGSLLLRLRAPDHSSYQRLDFDPRGQTLELTQNGNVLLTGVFSGGGEATTSRVSESATLRNLTTNTRASARAEFSRRSDASSTLTLRASRLVPADGPVSLFVNGQLVGLPAPVGKTGSMMMRFRTPLRAGYQELNFDPRGALIDLVQNGTPLFTGTLTSRALGANFERRTTIVVPLPAVSSAAVGSAKAKWRVDERARRKLEIEVEDAPEGDYAFLVDGVQRGVIQVVTTPEGLQGEIEFANDDDDPGALPLDFDPVGAVLAVAAGDVIWFSLEFTPADLNTRPASEPPSRLDERLAATSAASAGKAEARYEVDDKGRHRFKVELEGVAPGLYPLLVGGVQRALIRVVPPPAAPAPAPAPRKNGDDDTGGDDDNGGDDAGNVAWGEVEFRSVVEPRKILLNFDPRGQLIEIVSPEGVVLFSHVLGTGSASGTAGGDVVLPFEVTQPLFAQAGAVGSVQATFRRRDGGELKLKLKARGLPVGDYEVVVGNQVRGTLSMLADDGGTEGEIEFETVPEAGSLALNFAVEGAEIAIRQGGVILFARVLDLP